MKDISLKVPHITEEVDIGTNSVMLIFYLNKKKENVGMDPARKKHSKDAQISYCFPQICTKQYELNRILSWMWYLMKVTIALSDIMVVTKFNAQVT